MPKEICLLRINDLNTKMKALDKKITTLTDTLDYMNIKLNEIHDETFNLSTSSLGSSISPISSPVKERVSYKIKSNNTKLKDSINYGDKSMLPIKADYTYLGNKAIPAFKSYRRASCNFPEINRKRTSFNEHNN